MKVGKSLAETQVRTPSGEVVTVRHPEGATDAEIIAFAQRVPAPETPTPAPQDAPWYMDALAGMAPQMAQNIQSGDVRALAQQFPEVTGFGKGIESMRQNLAENVGGMPTLPGAGVVQPFLSDVAESVRPEQDTQIDPSVSDSLRYSGGNIAARMTPGLLMGPATIPGTVAAGSATALTEENPVAAGLLATGLGSAGVLSGGLLGRISNAFRGNLPVQVASGADDAARLAAGGTIRNMADDVDPSGVIQGMQRRGYRFPGLEKSGRGVQTQALDDVVSKHPWTTRITEQVADTNQGLLQREIAESLGTRIDRFDDANLGLIQDELSSKYNQIADAIGSVELPKGFADDFQKVASSVQFERFSDELADGVVSGKTLQRMRTIASRKTTSPAIRDEAIDVLEVLDDAVQKKVPDSMKSMYAEVREQWRNFYQLAKIKSGTLRNEITGEVAPGTLGTNLRRTYGTQQPLLPATSNLRESALGMGGIKPFQHSPGTAETLTLMDLTRQALTSPPAMLGAARMGAQNPAWASVGGLLGRGVSPALLQLETQP